MSWLYSLALVEEYLEGSSWDGEPSAQLNVMPTQHKFWRNDKTMDFSNLSQFGLTCAVLTEQHGEALLTWYLGDFHVKTLAQQEKAQELKASEAECGKKWRGLLAKFDPSTHSWKTAQCSLLEDLEQSLQTWPRWGSMRNGECFQQPMLAHLTDEKEYGLLPDNETFFHTPNTTGMDGGSNSRKALKKRMANTPSGNWPTRTCADTRTDKLKSTQQTPGSMHSVSLAQAVQMWPTPDANMGARGTQPEWQPIRKSGHHAQYSINQAVRDSITFPTPQASDNRDRGNLSNPSVQRRIEIGKQISLSQSVSENSGKLNPNWVEWLMNWPIKWTELKNEYECNTQESAKGDFNTWLELSSMQFNGKPTQTPSRLQQTVKCGNNLREMPRKATRFRAVEESHKNKNMPKLQKYIHIQTCKTTDVQPILRSQTCLGESWWKKEPNIARVANGVIYSMDRLKAIGNGQVPLCAATAFELLIARLE